MTIYCTPYNALISELGNNQKNRVNVSTFISLTYIVGLSLSYLVPNIASLFEGLVGAENSVKLAIGLLSLVAAIAMLIPGFTIKESDYIGKEFEFRVIKKNGRDVVVSRRVLLEETQNAGIETFLNNLQENDIINKFFITFNNGRYKRRIF